MTLNRHFGALALVLCTAILLVVRDAAAATSRTRAVAAPINGEGAMPVTGEGAIRFARRLLGTPYLYGGTSPSGGFDCSGFVQFVFEHFGIELPHSSYAQFGYGRDVPRGALKPGDLVFFDGRGHVGLYVGDGRFIHAPHTGSNVSIDSMDDASWYGARYEGARRLVRAA